MDWELNERYQAFTLLAILTLLSFSLLVFRNTGFVRHMRSVLQLAAGPTQRFLSQWHPETAVSSPSENVTPDNRIAPPLWALTPESSRAVQVLNLENQRLRETLSLRQARWPKAVAAHVIGRDPQRWFQEIVIDRGREQGVLPESAVIAMVDGREGLVGRVVEVMDHTSKVLLIQDSLSAVAARLASAATEDGVVEGTNGHELVLKYLDRGSQVKVGDAVVTAGLGDNVPAEIPIGWVEDIHVDPRQLFLQAKLRPTVPTNRLRIVLVLVPQGS